MSVVEDIAAFLNEVGVPCRSAPLPEATFLPGLLLEAGALVFDPERLAFPGDLLHEAGHIATAAPSARTQLSGNIVGTPGDEMAAIAWSYAACMHLGLDVRVLFHPAGYKGGSESLIASFATRQPVGVPLLAWYGMTTVATGTDGAFPAMRCWLRMTEPPAS